MVSEKLSAALSWSVMSPKPIFVHHKKYDAHLVFWNGVAMTRAYATMIMCTTWMNMYFGESMKDEAWEEYNRLYRLGAFGHFDWDEQLNTKGPMSMINYLTNLVNTRGSLKVVRGHIDTSDGFFIGLTEKYTAKDVMEWLLYANETCIEDLDF